jgi:hypothetical protein
MLTDIGEFVVGVHLQVKLDCDVVDYSVRPRGGGLAGLEESDVVGFNHPEHKAYLCEVTAHIREVLYKDTANTIDRIRREYERQKWYGKEYLHGFQGEYMFWFPVLHSAHRRTHFPVISGALAGVSDREVLRPR